jgi:uncharacterized membrane protein YkoI
MNPERTSPGAAQSQSQSSESAQPEPQGTQSDRMESQYPSRELSGERVPQADIAAARNAKVSLTDAISAAQQQSHGNVVSARFEVRQGKPEYLVRTFDTIRQQEWVGHIDANTGQVIGQGQTVPLRRLPREDRQELTALPGTSTTLAQAVQTAEQQRGGKALAASLSARNGQVRCQTQLLKSNGSTQMAMINPQSGQISRYR